MIRTVLRRVWERGSPLELLTCGHTVATTWRAARGKEDVPTRIDCTRCDPRPEREMSEEDLAIIVAAAKALDPR